MLCVSKISERPGMYLPTREETKEEVRPSTRNPTVCNLTFGKSSFVICDYISFAERKHRYRYHRNNQYTNHATSHYCWCPFPPRLEFLRWNRPLQLPIARVQHKHLGCFLRVSQCRSDVTDTTGVWTGDGVYCHSEDI